VSPLPGSHRPESGGCGCRSGRAAPTGWELVARHGRRRAQPRSPASRPQVVASTDPARPGHGPGPGPVFAVVDLPRLVRASSRPHRSRRATVSCSGSSTRTGDVDRRRVCRCRRGTRRAARGPSNRAIDHSRELRSGLRGGSRFSGRGWDGRTHRGLRRSASPAGAGPGSLTGSTAG